VDEGFSLKEIGDHLGHCSAYATRTYAQGSDVQRLLPQLATYLGHVHIAATQRYLTMTPELLREASKRFERYAWEESHE